MCIVCGTDDNDELCLSSRRQLRNPPSLCAEHIWWTEAPSTPCKAALVDQWGRPHFLDAETIVGRDPGRGIVVLERSVSRRHARLTTNGGPWLVEDLGGRNGTFIEDKRVTEPTPIPPHARLVFGDVAFYFFEHGRAPGQDIAAPSTRRVQGILGAAPASSTALGLVVMADGSHVLELKGLEVRLSATQFELVALLAERMQAEATEPALVRGFVPSAELLAQLPWDTPYPVDNQLTQLVRRVRKATKAAGMGELIESRPNFGYRLTVAKHVRLRR